MGTRRAYTLGVFVVALLASASLWRVDEPVGWSLSEGRYQISFHATRGSRTGVTSEGLLTLRKTSADDVSPRTGQRAERSDPNFLPLYGWTDADLHAVGAALEDEPLPSSTDPVFPGVVVLTPHRILDPIQRPRDAPVLAIGSLANTRLDRRTVDGSGIGLFVQRRDGTCWRGQWLMFGLERDGEGDFAFCRIRQANEP